MKNFKWKNLIKTKHSIFKIRKSILNAIIHLKRKKRCLKEYNKIPYIIEKCPMCHSNSFKVINTYKINSLVKQWEKEYNFFPIAKCYYGKILEKRICNRCGTHYYNYRLPDTAEFYEILTDLHPIYRKEKWEYSQAEGIITEYKPLTLLDIGCGYGYFLDKVKDKIPNIYGAEFNPLAIKTCKDKGYRIFDTELDKIEVKFDIITAFQVLEHIEDIKSFVENCINLLNKNGKLLFVTPNPDSEVIKNNGGILELPPHHNADISKTSYEFIAQKYDLEILEYQEEEIGFYHYKTICKNKSKLDYENKKNNFKGKSHLVLFERKTQ